MSEQSPKEETREAATQLETEAQSAEQERALQIRDGSQALVTTAARVPDAYEQKYMPGQGLVLHRHKSRAPWQLNAIFGASSLALLAPAFAGAWLATLVAMPIMLVIWALFSVLRTTVSEGMVNVQYGLFGPTIPIESIESAKATRYDWKKYGGWESSVLSTVSGSTTCQATVETRYESTGATLGARRK